MTDYVNFEEGLRLEAAKPLHGHPRFIELVMEEIVLHSAKNSDYARYGEALGNFHRVSEMFRTMGIHTTPAQVAFTYMMKQLDAAGQMIVYDYEGQSEGLKGRLQDISVYAKLIQILKEEEHGN